MISIKKLMIALVFFMLFSYLIVWLLANFVTPQITDIKQEVSLNNILDKE